MTSATIDQAETIEERAEAARDLRAAARQMLGADAERQEWEITDTSPNRKLYVLYSTIDGTKIAVPKFVFDAAITQEVYAKGGWRYVWTASKDKAPLAKVGNIKCILHPEAPERELLEEVGVTQECYADELRSNMSKRVHAQHRHPTAWAAYQEYIALKRDDEFREQMAMQTEATLELARAASATVQAGTTPVKAKGGSD